MSTQCNHRKKSLQGKVSSHTSGINNPTNVAARYRLIKFKNKNDGKVDNQQIDKSFV